MIVLSRSIILDTTLTGGRTPTLDNPIIGYRNLVTATNVSATQADASHPVSELGNPLTHLYWLATSAIAQYVTVTLVTPAQFDYIAIARHNLYSAQVPVTVQGYDVDTSSWVELVQETVLPDDEPALFRFTKKTLLGIRLYLGAGAGIPSIAVIYAGELLVLPSRIYVGHTPIKYGRMTEVMNGRSQAGDFLGNIVLHETRRGSFSLQNMMPDWYRTYMDPFIVNSKTLPFFFSWRPGSYPSEVGYCWVTNDPQPKNQRPNGMMNIDVSLGGIAS